MVEDPRWRSHRGLQARLKRAAEAARKRGAGCKGDFTILLAGDKKLRALNRDFRGKDKPTNVLSFPARGWRLCRRHRHRLWRDRQRSQGGGQEVSPTMPSIWWCMACCIWPAMITNGRKDAKVMEPLEVKILARLGIADPYAAIAAR